MTYEQRMERLRGKADGRRFAGRWLSTMRAEYLREPIHRSSSLRGVMDLAPYSMAPEFTTAPKEEE